MIIVRAPYCVSFFANDHDHARLLANGERASALCATIAHHAYAQIQPRGAEASMQAPHHTLVREMLARHGANLPSDVEVLTHFDTPFSGAPGQDAAFASAALLATLGAQGRHCGKRDIASGALDMAPHLSAHDTVACAYGGFQRIDVEPNGAFRAAPLRISETRRHALEKRLLLVCVQSTPRGAPLHALRDLTDIIGEGQRVLENPLAPLSRFGKLMHKAWRLTQPASDIAGIYAAARAAGALGGRCDDQSLLLYTPPRHAHSVRAALSGLTVAPVQFDRDGASILHYAPDYEAARALQSA